MGAYERLKNEKAKVFPSFFFCCAASLPTMAVSVRLKCLDDSKADAAILSYHSRLTSEKPLWYHLSLFLVQRKILVLKLKVVKELSE